MNRLGTHRIYGPLPSTGGVMMYDSKPKLRDKLAEQAMFAVLLRRDGDAAGIAKFAYEVADAMLKERVT